MKNVMGITGDAVVTVLTVMKTFTISIPTEEILDRQPPRLIRIFLEQGKRRISPVCDSS